MKKFYIAYGSNLNIEQMSWRCPTASIRGKGMLKDWTLIFRSMRGPAYATIQKETGSSVPVVVWEIDRRSEFSLDRYEGYPSFYYKEDIEVTMDNGEVIMGMAYIMNQRTIPGTPSKSYVKTILDGYLDNGLDLSYLERFLSIQ